MMLVLRCYLESISLVKSSQKHHIQNSQSIKPHKLHYKYNPLVKSSEVIKTSYLKLTIRSFIPHYKYRQPSEDIYPLSVLGNVILLCAVHYNYNALCGVVQYMRFVALHVPLILSVKVLPFL